ncbi:hypothetical protein CbuK_A0023 (plasmid) [Coxiella burnetii CbuK_Q154]|nr:hypothetical protein CbuK_A0023 [Coxiella burnetii CbuK_Q154]EAX32545.1 hypothetical protein A35_0038 [Coxiella burnetii 'MSU Goat Q177']
MNKPNDGVKFFMTDEEAALAILKKTNFFAQVVKNQKLAHRPSIPYNG